MPFPPQFAYLQNTTTFSVLSLIQTNLKLKPSFTDSLKNITPPLPLDKMEVIFQAFLDDEWYDHIVQWRLSSTKRKDIIEDPYEFYYPPQQRVPGREPVAPAAAAPAA